MTSSWHRALTLTERLPAPASPDDGALARRRLERWREQPPYNEESGLFAERLATDGLSEESFLALLGESEASLQSRLPQPEWLLEMETALAGEDVELPPFDTVANRTGVGFLGLVLPFLRTGYGRLLRGLTGIGGPFDPAAVGPLLFQSLLERQLSLIPRTLVLELQAARLEESLEGETAEERFASFAARLRDPEERREILERYPVLARLSWSLTRDWLEVSLETFRRLRDDWPEIAAAFSPERDPGRVRALWQGAGDLHRGGRSVTILRFESGLRVVYKPRSLAAEAAFQRLLAWTSGRGFSPALPVLKILDRGSHGWMEFVAASSCSGVEEVRRFYERQGGYLALFYLLDASDQHQENILAAGENPYPVDLETLFHPRVDGPRVEDPDEIPGSGLFHSILRVGFVPKWTSAPGGARMDHSGLGSVEGQESRHPLLHLDGEATDDLRFDRRPAALPGARNRPALEGREIELPDFAAELTAGFERMYRALLAHREELLAADGPLSAFAGAETRVVFRPTSTYGELLTESFHPDVLGNALLRDRLLDRLWVAVPRKPYLAGLIAAERTDLTRGDIPLFTSRPDSADLVTSRGTLPGFFSETGMDRARENVERLSERDLTLQLWTLQGCLTALDLSRRLTLTVPYQLQATSAPPDRSAFLEAARAVGDRLESLAFRGARDAWWLTIAALAEGRWSFATCQADLYEGAPGIVLFLAELERATGEGRFGDLARRGLAAVDALLERGTVALRVPGAWNGIGGLIYTFSRLGVLWGDESLLERAASWLPDLRAVAEGDDHFDLMNGAAGAIAALLALHEVRPEAGALEVARVCGERLAAGAVPQARGVAWPPSVPGIQPLAGFSHGTAGMSWALLRLAGATGDERFRDLGLAALEYERSVYDPEQKNWPDFREYGVTQMKDFHLDPFMTAWCNGAAGVGLARLGTLPLLDGPEVREEIAAAVETTLSRGFGKNHCLCHGDLGNVELLLEAGRRLGDRELEEKAYRIAGGVLEDIRANGWRLGMPKGSEPPGLMVGLAGVGYGLLRMAEPEGVPSVLLMDPL